MLRIMSIPSIIILVKWSDMVRWSYRERRWTDILSRNFVYAFIYTFS